MGEAKNAVVTLWMELRKGTDEEVESSNNEEDIVRSHRTGKETTKVPPRCYKTLGRRLKGSSADFVTTRQYVERVVVATNAKRLLTLLVRRKRLSHRVLRLINPSKRSRKENEAASIISKVEPNRVQCSLKKAARAAVPLSFVPLLPDTARESILPFPSTEQDKNVLGVGLERFIDGRLQCGSNQKGKGLANVKIGGTIVLIETFIPDTVTPPPFSSGEQGPHVVNPSHHIPLSTDVILKSATARRVFLKDHISAKWVLSGSLEHQIRSYMDFSIVFIININVTAKERDAAIHENDVMAKAMDALRERVATLEAENAALFTKNK
ncbi:hypothetical protein ACOSQ2_018605 [Xanthoceras sorbifolium]